MRRVNGFAVLGRAMEGGLATSAARTHHRLLLAELYNTSSTSKQCWFSNRFSDCGGLSALSVARGVSGSKFFSVAATSLAQDAHVKEPLLSEKFLPKEVVLYQYEACPLCNKVKAFLDYNDVPYKVVEVNPISKKEIEWSDCKKVPILTIDGEQMVDSSGIIDKLFNKIHPENSSPNSDEERKWREWVDNHLVHVLSPNIYRSASEALESFDYITTHGNFSITERIVAKYAGAAVMYFVSKKLKKEHNITDERISLYEAAKTWVDALQGRQFLGGFEPNLADLAVFGVLRPIRYLQSGKDMVEHTRIGEWYGRMEYVVGEGPRMVGEGPRMMENFLTNSNTLMINSSNEMGSNGLVRKWYGMMENGMGAGSRKMEDMLTKNTNSGIVVIKSVKVRSIYLSASMIAQEIALRVKKLKKRAFRSIFLHFAHNIPLVMKKRVIGLRISCSGRLRGRAIASTYCGKYGKTSLAVLDQRIDYAFRKVPTRYGILGVKVWITYRKKRV